jgi:AcrR family transcriptional regulator
MRDTGGDPRTRLVIGAADMIRRRGLNATSVRELAKHARAPLGSTYHYFPRGKQQLACEAIRFSGDVVARTLAAKLEDGPLAGLRAFLSSWREVVLSTDFRAGCPVLAVSVEEPDDGATEPLAAAAEVFGSWELLLANALRDAGAADEDADRVATLVVAAVEGTVAMCRAKRSIEPLDRIAGQLELAVMAVTTAR